MAPSQGAFLGLAQRALSNGTGRCSLPPADLHFPRRHRRVVVGVSVFLSCGYSSLSTYGRLAEQRPGLPQDPGPSVHLVQQQPPPPAGILCSFRSVTGAGGL